jgi:cystathionine beta-synthase
LWRRIGRHHPDLESLTVTRELLQREGILAGTSTGTLLAAALRYCRAQKTPKRVVTFVCDTGGKYLSKVFNDYWMIDQGFIQRPAAGDLRDLITRRFEEGAVIVIGPDDSLLTAFQRMRMADISQVPVIENGVVVGILDESDLLMSIHADPQCFARPVRTAMTRKLETLPPEASLEDACRVLEKGQVVLVLEGDDFLGLITRTDLMNHLRQTLI